MIKHIGYDITFQEVPNETTLVIPISNCPFHCEGCHSPLLREDVGEDLEKDLPVLLEKYKDTVTCVCFMGDGQDAEDMASLIRMVQNDDLKTAIYSGYADWSNVEAISKHLDRYIDYVKIGPYIAALGGLAERTTNQRMYQFVRCTDEAYEDKNEPLCSKYTDITYLFQEEKK